LEETIEQIVGNTLDEIIAEEIIEPSKEEEKVSEEVKEEVQENIVKPDNQKKADRVIITKSSDIGKIVLKPK
jgi:hypothetical protein